MKNEKIAKLVEDLQQKHYSGLVELKEKCVELEEIAIQENDLYALASAKVNLAYYFFSNGLYGECREYVEEGVLICEKGHYDDLLLRGYNTFALLYKNLHDDNMALEYFLKAMQLAGRNNNNEYLGKLLNNIGDMFLQLKEYNVSYSYFTEGYNYVKKQEDSTNKFLTLAIILLNIADVEQHLGKYQESLTKIDECEEVIRNFKSSILMDCVYGYRAYAHYYLGNSEQANSCITQLIENMDEVTKTDLINRFSLYRMIVELLITMEDAEKCEIFVNKLIEISDHLQSPNYKMQAEEWNVKYRKALLNGEGVLECYEKYYSYAMENKVQNLKNRSSSLKVKLDLMNALLEKEKIEKKNAELQELSTLDELTNIPNRRSFNRKLANALKTMKKYENIAVIISDVDYFKQYNDYYGHLAGDDVLRSVATCLKCEDERFYPTRFGGDEFIVIACNVKQEEIETYVQEVYKKVAACAIEHQKSKCSTMVTISTGYCYMKVEEATMQGLIESADEALYQAKEKGKNCYCGASHI